MWSVDPRDGVAFAEWREHDRTEVEARLEAAADAAAAWRSVGLDARADALRRLADGIELGADALSAAMTREVGKPVQQSRGELAKCALALRWVADRGPAALAEQPSDWPGATVRLEPLGVLLAVMPWNFPFWQVIRCAAPSLLLGNAVLVKHAENTQGMADALAGIAQAALPPGLLQRLTVDRATTLALIDDPRVAAVTLTGSERAGRAVGAAAGAALKPCVLELGGSDAFVVLDDVDVGVVAAAAAGARLQNNGQSCIAAKRFVVLDAVADRFVDAFTAAIDVPLTDPLDPACQLGPLAREDLRDALHAQVQASIAVGARRLIGGAVPDRPGWWYPATVLLDDGAAPVSTEETFGPVAVVLRARDDADAVRVANATRYGLGASVWSSDPDRAAALASRLRSGMVAVNRIVASHPAVPFGGVGLSGFGRELGLPGYAAFANVRTWTR